MRFNYQIRDKEGGVNTGVVEASSQEAALQIISRPGLFVTFLERIESSPFSGGKIQFFDKISAKEVMLFSRQLAIMFKAQVSPLDSLESIADQTSNKSFQEKIFSMSENIEGGTSLSGAFMKYPKIFSFFYVSMVKRGEALGNLSDVLEYLADHLEREQELSGKLKTAMIYPIFVLFIAAAVIILLMTLVIPNLATILQDSGQELPIMTKIVIAGSNFLITKGWIVAILFIVIGVGVFRFIKTPNGKRFFDHAILKVPGINSFLRVVYISRFGESLATLIAGGVSLVHALEITKDIVGNARYQEIIIEAKEEVEGGVQVSEVLKKYPSEFPPIFTQMVAVGERSGNIETTLNSIVVYYRKEVDRNVDGLLSVIEPVLIVFLGVVVGGLMASVILPLYSISSSF